MLNRTVLLIEISEYRCWQLAIDLLSTLGKLSLSSRTQRQWQWATIATGMHACSLPNLMVHFHCCIGALFRITNK